MSRSPLVLWVTPLLFSALAMAQPRFTAGVHEDPRLGYKIKVPEKWTMVPVDIDEKWIVAKYLCNREYAGKVSYMAWTPQMRIVHFSPEKAKVTEKTETRGDTTYMSKQAAFRHYKDWFKEIIKSTNLGHYIESETTDTLGDVPVTRFEIMTTSSNEKALKFVCWVYERKSDGSTFAVEFSQINDYYKNLADDFERSFKSFRFTDVEAGNGAAAADSELENPMWTRDREKWRELPKQERWKIRQAMEIKRRDRVLADVPQGWFVQESKSKRFTAISHTDKKHTTLVLDTAEAVWNWVDKRFNSLSDEYVMAGVIRICEDWNEANTYGAKSAALDSYSPDDREIVIWKDRDAGTSGGVQNHLQTALVMSYLYDKDSNANFTPGWLVVGLSGYLASAEVEGGKLAFKNSNYERIFIREAEREGALRSFNELISTITDEWPREGRPFARMVFQLFGLVRFLESKEMDRLKSLQNFLPRYVAAVIKAGEEWRKQRPATAQATTEAEEEARAKDRSKARKEEEKFILDAVNKELTGFSQKEWQQIEAAWKRWLQK